MAACLLAIAVVLVWANTRISIMRLNQDPSHPAIYDTYQMYHAMAMALREGRVGQVDLAMLRRHSLLNDPSAPYERLPPDAAHQWVNYYTLDIGYSFIVEAARLAFPPLPDNQLRSVALQLSADAMLAAFLFFVFSQGNLWLGFASVALYSLNLTARFLVSVAFYYYWDIPLTFVVLGSFMLALRRPDEAPQWLAVVGLALGFGVWLRGSWWPLSLFLLGVALVSPVRRRDLVVPVLAFTLLATPQVVRSSLARHHLALSTRAIWHVALVGLGYSPNPYGLELKDATIFQLTHDKYGVTFNVADYDEHDQAARKEFLSIWAKDRGFVLRTFWTRLKDSVAGSLEAPSYSFISNINYRLLCLVGFFLMFWRGGSRRFAALSAGGTYAIYVGLTCVFYYVGLAYDTVTQATLLILFLGGIDVLIETMRDMAPRGAGREDATRESMATA